MFDRSEIQKGMTVRSNDGHKLGRITSIQGEDLIVEKGWLWRKDFVVSMADVREVAHGEVLIHHGRDSLFSAPREVAPPPHTRGLRPPISPLPGRQQG